MQKYKNIKALFFLGVFSLLLLHQAMPHWHHQHGEHNHGHDVAHHHHHNQDHHHHHDKSEGDQSKKGFLDWFLELHTHTNTTTDVLVLEQTTGKKVTAEKESLRTLLPVTVYPVFGEVAITIDEWYYPPDNRQNKSFSSLTLRGPPSLG